MVLAEASLGVAVLLLTGLLTSTTPPHGSAFEPQAVGQSTSSPLIATPDDLLMTLSAEPNVPGENVISIGASLVAGVSPEVLRVILHFTYLGHNMGTATADAQQAAPDLYQLSGSQFSLAGPWKVDVAVRRKGVEDSVAHFTWTVLAGASARRVLVSDRPWEGPLVAAAAILALAIAATIVWLVLRRAASRRITLPEPRAPRHRSP